MLKELYIKNIAIIKDERVCPGDALTVLTGETGAGKSIIIDSVCLIIGERASKELIRGGEEKAVVSALFENISEEAAAIASELGVDTEGGTLLVQRDITDKGGSTARINGRTVPLSIVREIASKLIHIHGQHTGGDLLDEDSHIVFLDAFADAEKEKEEYLTYYHEMQKIKKRIAEISHDEREGEEEDLKKKRTKVQNAEKIGKHAKLIYRALYQNEKGFSACDLIEKAEESLSALEGVLGEANTFAETLADFRYRIEDIAETIRKECDMGIKNPSELLDKIEERLDNLQRLRKKYGGTVEEIKKYRERIAAKLHDLEMSGELSEDLENELADVRAKMKAIAAEITKKRRCAAEYLQKKITDELVFLDMEKVRFRIEITALPEFSTNGVDKVAFAVSANPGEPLQPLSKVASGGELSRMMLALRCAFADKEHTETMIFDEIDTGISGKTSHKIGVKLHEVAKKGTQVICVTHSPQIAAIADTHLFVSKTETEGRTESSVKVLTEEEHVTEVARIIGGASITEQTLAAARELCGADHS